MVVQPVGPLSASTYWRRRAVLLGAVVVVVLLLRSCTGGGSTPTASPAASPTPTRTASPPPVPVRTTAAPVPPVVPPSATATVQPADGRCPDSALSLVASADAPSYAAGSSPLLSLTARNTGSVPCRRDLGSGMVELLVFSGPDRIWSSDDCSAGTGTDTVLLAPGASRTVKLSWSGKRSAPGCAGTRTQAQPGTYQVTGRVGTLRRAGGTFVLR